VPVHTFFGQASLYMFLVYGAICVFGLEPAYRFLKNRDVPIFFRGLVYMCIILGMECSLGWVLKFATGYDIWIYYGPGTLFTYTSLAIAPMWFICGLISENVISVIDSLDDLKLSAYGISDASAVPADPGARDRIVFISDVHIGQRNADGSPAGWFYGMYEVYLTIILFKVSMDRRVRELVFLGDLFDTWMYPPEEKPQSVAEIVAAWSGSLFMAPLLKCIASLDAVYYIPGNHDMQVTQDDLSALSSGGKGIKLVTAAEYNAEKRLRCGAEFHVEHGNDGDFFNAPDDDHDSVQGLPFGYFVSRIVSAAEDFDVESVFRSAYAKVLASDFVEKKGESADNRAGRLFVRFFLDAVIAWANTKREDGQKLGNSTVVVLPEGYTDVTIADVKQCYSSLLPQWLESRQTYMFAAAGKSGLDRYARKKFGEKGRFLWVKRLFSCAPPELVVIMGHTHFAKQERVMNREKQGIYANTGCVCQNKKQTGVHWLVLTDSSSGCSVKIERM
jgi:UDP-2,3-diacylglucosamine pyrophosphatase LpxH